MLRRSTHERTDREICSRVSHLVLRGVGGRRGTGVVGAVAVATASLVFALGAPGAQAVITTPIPADPGPVPPPTPTLPTAGEAAPPADVIADPVEPAASCGGWSRQDLYAGAWPAGATWWEYQCTYAYPVCGPGACNADWSPSIWTDYFYWDGSRPVFYGETTATTTTDRTATTGGISPRLAGIGSIRPPVPSRGQAMPPPAPVSPSAARA